MLDKIQTTLSSLLPSSSTTGQASSTGSKTPDPFSALNLDSLNLSKDAQNKITWARAQFQLNYQVLSSMNTANGVETTQQSFSFQASYEFLERSTGRDPSASPLSFFQQLGGAENQDKTTEAESGQNLLSALKDYFSPEKTAERILDVALSFYPSSDAAQQEGEEATKRKSFADFIGGAIKEGFSQARTILGALPEDVSKGIDTTFDLVTSGLEDFVTNGVNPEKLQPGGVMEKIASYRQEAIDNSKKLQETMAGQKNYTASGDLTSLAGASTISTKV